MTAEVQAHNIRVAVDRLAKEIADRVTVENHNKVELTERPDMQMMLDTIDRTTHEMVERHARATLIDWLLGDWKSQL